MSRSRSLLFNPLIGLTIALSASVMFALFAIWRYDGEWRDLLVFYFAPIGVPFILFVFDRAEQWRTSLWLIDFPVIVLALLRSAYPIPIVSGHSLFLTYALLTTRSWVARLAALVILVQVIILKTFVWHDVTLLGGVLVGSAAAWLHRRWTKRGISS